MLSVTPSLHPHLSRPMPLPPRPLADMRLALRPCHFPHPQQHPAHRPCLPLPPLLHMHSLPQRPRHTTPPAHLRLHTRLTCLGLRSGLHPVLGRSGRRRGPSFPPNGVSSLVRLALSTPINRPYLPPRHHRCYPPHPLHRACQLHPLPSLPAANRLVSAPRTTPQHFDQALLAFPALEAPDHQRMSPHKFGRPISTLGLPGLSPHILLSRLIRLTVHKLSGPTTKGLFPSVPPPSPPRVRRCHKAVCPVSR